MKVIVGLGNPGLEYYFTRHNAGFNAIDAIGRHCQTGGVHFQSKKSLFCDLGKVDLLGSQVLLVKPTTYMNESGKCVQALLNWYKLDLEDLLVIHDDVSLPLGKIRLQKGGGAGGQHGVESIIESFGGVKEFDRIKIGVGPDPGGDRRARYVLQNIPESDKKIFEKVLNLVAEASTHWLRDGVDKAANKFNGISFVEIPVDQAELDVSKDIDDISGGN